MASRRRKALEAGYGDAIEIAPYFTKGGQGKFFRDPKPNDANRWPRGYTPERMSEVRRLPIEVEAGIPGVDSLTGPAGRRTAFTGPAGARRVLETIARSTTPAEEFTHPTTPWGTEKDPDDLYPLHIRTGVDPLLRGRLGAAAGTFQPGGHSERGLIHVGPHHGQFEEAAAHTLMHEMGHARSKAEHTAAYDTPTQRGKEEARADDNMLERFRPDPRDVRRGRAARAVERPDPMDPLREPGAYDWNLHNKRQLGLRPKAVYESRGAWEGYGGRVGHQAYLKARQQPLAEPWHGPQELQLNLFKRDHTTGEIVPHPAALFNDRRA